MQAVLISRNHTNTRLISFTKMVQSRDQLFLYTDRETGFSIGMDRNFVCLWRRHNCISQVIDLSLCALISWFMKSIIRFLNNSNLHAIICTSLIKKNNFAVSEEIYNNVVPHWSAVLLSCNHSITGLISFFFYKKRFKSEINSFLNGLSRFYTIPCMVLILLIRFL